MGSSARTRPNSAEPDGEPAAGPRPLGPGHRRDVEGVVEDAGVAVQRRQRGAGPERGVPGDLVVLLRGQAEGGAGGGDVVGQLHQVLDELGAHGGELRGRQRGQVERRTVAAGRLGLRRGQQDEHEEPGYVPPPRPPGRSGVFARPSGVLQDLPKRERPPGSVRRLARPALPPTRETRKSLPCHSTFAGPEGRVYGWMRAHRGRRMRGSRGGQGVRRRVRRVRHTLVARIAAGGLPVDLGPG